MKFWDRVEACEHKNFNPNYFEHVDCGTPYCSGDESHCLDCKVFITECKCGAQSGMSGWSNKKYMRYWAKKERQI